MKDTFINGLVNKGSGGHDFGYNKKNYLHMMTQQRHKDAKNSPPPEAKSSLNQGPKNEIKSLIVMNPSFNNQYTIVHKRSTSGISNQDMPNPMSACEIGDNDSLGASRNSMQNWQKRAGAINLKRRSKNERKGFGLQSI